MIILATHQDQVWYWGYGVRNSFVIVKLFPHDEKISLTVDCNLTNSMAVVKRISSPGSEEKLLSSPSAETSDATHRAHRSLQGCYWCIVARRVHDSTLQIYRNVHVSDLIMMDLNWKLGTCNLSAYNNLKTLPWDEYLSSRVVCVLQERPWISLSHNA